jgi:hypothetical protein
LTALDDCMEHAQRSGRALDSNLFVRDGHIGYAPPSHRATRQKDR